MGSGQEAIEEIKEGAQMNRKRRTCYHENGCGRCNGEKNTRGKIYRRCFLCAAYEPIKKPGDHPGK